MGPNPTWGLKSSVRSLKKEQNKDKIGKNKANKRVNLVYGNIKRIPRGMSGGKNKKVTERTSEEIDFTKPRDLYNRQDRLKNSLETVNALPSPDREDILTHVQYLTDNRRAILTIIRNISVLITLREKLKKSFRDAIVADCEKRLLTLKMKGGKQRKVG